MPVTHVDPATGNLVVAGKPVFPLGLSDPPPVGGTTPSGTPAWREIAAAGVNFARDYAVWSAATVAERLLEVGSRLDNARAHGVDVWLALAGIDDDLTHRALVDQVVATVKDHPALAVWKGADEPAHGRVPAAGLAAFHAHLKAIDPSHPLAIIEAPRDPAPTSGARDRPLTAAGVRPYAAACDVHGVDIYPVSIPPGAHAGGPPVHTDIGVVGDVTRIVATATGRKAIWTTLQIAWSGTLPPHPVVFPTLQQARFMAYDAILAGARGLFFFGGHLPQAMTARDRAHGWNWTYWQNVQRPLVEELSGPAHRDALLAPKAPFTVKADAADVLVGARETADAIYVIAVRRGGATGRVRFSGLPAAAGAGTVLAHGPGNPPRPVAAHAGGFTDPSPYEPHTARVYRFARG
jgi:hypothetical protein